MNRNTNKLKRIHSKSNQKVSTAQKRIRNENEKRRRDLFSQLITNLGDVISTKNQLNKLSKNSILRQAVAFLQQYRHILTNESKFELSNNSSTSSTKSDILLFSWKPSNDIINIEEWFEIAIQSMNCFFLVVKDNLSDNKIVYVSKNINNYLGYSQDEILNNSLFHFILSSNHNKLRDYLNNNHQVLEKCDVSWKQSINDDYEQCTIIGAFRTINENEKYLISIVKLNTLDRTLNLNNEYLEEELIMNINNHGKFIFINSKARQVFGYNSFELIGQTFFDFVHPDDLTIIIRAHQLWKENGNGKSDPYRFLTKGQQWIFVQTYSQVQINSWTGKPESYICTTNIIQCDSLQKQLAKYIQPNYSKNLVESSILPTTTTTMSLTVDYQKNIGSSENEITSFLSHLDNEIYRKTIHEKLLELRKTKEAEIRVRQEEIQVIEDIIQFINQYQSKTSSNNQTKNIITEEFLSNMFDTNTDLTLFNSPFSANIDDYSIPINESLFSPSSILSPLTSTNNHPIQDINYLPTTNNTFTENTFP